MAQAKKATFDGYKKDALKAAKDLGYDKSIQAKIHNAESESEIDKILIEARHSMK